MHLMRIPESTLWGDLWKYWEPNNCQHCKNLDACLIRLDPPTRWAQMGILKVMLDKQQTKVNDIDSLREWQYLPIFEYTLKKFHFAQNGLIEQVPGLNPPQLQRLNTPSPID